MCGAAGLRCAVVDRSAPGNFETDEARGDDRLFELSFQDSTRNSTGPQINVLFGVGRDGFLDQDIGDLQTASRLEDTRHL